METINGVWYMKGCRRSDKGCLHSPDDLLELVREVGFLPLFSNDIPGFSVEEHRSPTASSSTKRPGSFPGNGSRPLRTTGGTGMTMKGCMRTGK